jgi:glycerol-3-phosphate dehydrogenase (NAD(P)+)
MDRSVAAGFASDRPARLSPEWKGSPMIAVVGAGAMGAALGMHLAGSNPDTVLLATQWDSAVVDAWRAGDVHPTLGLAHPSLPCRAYVDWATELASAAVVIIAVATEGLRPVLEHAIAQARADACWVIATKGWQPDTLESPSEIAASLLGGGEQIVSLAGPALAAEIAVGAPTVLVCAGRDAGTTQRIARLLRGPALGTVVTNDVVGVEIGAAYKNVVAVAVGLCEGLSDRLIEWASVHAFANARAAVFAQGLTDMLRLAERLGGRADTILGLAGAGDLYVTCLGGRNASFGRLLGSGQTPDQARKAIGSTIEGIANCAAALELAARESIELPTARIVEAALAQRLDDADSANEVTRLLVSGLAGTTEPAHEATGPDRR